MAKKNIVWFSEVGKDDVGIVGGKGANLGEMVNAGLPIPYGFIVTAQAYFQFLKEAKLDAEIKKTVSMINYDNPAELRAASSYIRKLIEDSPFPDHLAHEIIEYYDYLVQKEEEIDKKNIHVLVKIKHRVKQLYKQPLLAVRSSATAEDLPNASFAGQQETYLNVCGDANLIKKVKQCWSSLFTQRAIYYRHEQGFDKFKVGLAVVCQRMVQSDKSGISFSIDPVTNNKQKIVIEAILGLGEYIVGGKVTPDHYEVDKNSFLILDKQIKFQNVMLTRSGLYNKEIKLKEKGRLQKISDQEIIKIAMLVKQIENHYFFPQDIEWAIEQDKVFIVQSRPITTIKNVETKKTKDDTGSLRLDTPLLIGSPASPGIATGTAAIITSPREIDKIKKGDVLVAPQTNPDYVPAMKKAVAIITEKGGRTSHAAIVSRELGIPAVVGADNATKKIKNEMVITVKGGTGEIFKGKTLPENTQSVFHNQQSSRLKTLTKVYVNLAEPEKAKEIAKQNVDGVGLLRAEFMIANIGVHPKEFIREKKESVFINKLTKDLLKFVEPFSPRPVVYRATDFKTNEYRNLKGGAKYEPKEENPMLGFRGASRYIVNSDVFLLELQAIANIWNSGFRNLHLMIPFVRTPWELIKIKDIVMRSGLLSLSDFKFLIMVEVPSAALGLDEFLKVGVDGVSIGTNDLTMMTLGVDRDNAEVANVYDERNPIIMKILKGIVETCEKFHVTSSICGQAASDYPEIVEELIKSGITSVSINPDAINRTRELIFNLEKKIYKKKK